MDTTLNPYLIECVEGACRREALAISLKLKRGIGSLATISATAILIGLFGTVLGIFNAFRPIGSRSAQIALTAEAIAQSLVPTLLGLFVAITAFIFYRYLCSRADAFELEMKGASVDLANRLLVCLRRAGHTDFLYFAPSTKRKRAFGGNPKSLPRFATDRIYRNGVLELIWPRLRSDLDADSAVLSGAFVLFAYGLLGWVVCSWQHRPIAGIIIAAYFTFSGWMVKRGSRAAIYVALAFFGLDAAINIVRYGWDVSSIFLIVAPVLLLGSLKAIRLPR